CRGAAVFDHQFADQALVSAARAGAGQLDLDDRQSAWLRARLPADDLPRDSLRLALGVPVSGPAQPRDHPAAGAGLPARQPAGRRTGRRPPNAVVVPVPGRSLLPRLAVLDAGDLQLRGADLSVGPQQLAADLSHQGARLRSATDQPVL